MRKLVLGMALASTALATPALARDKSWYVEVDGGAMIVEDLKFDIAGTKDAASQDHDYGYDFGGIVGYDFGGFRLEVEGSWREADPKRLTVGSLGIPGQAALPFGKAVGTYDYVAGDTNALSFMVNGLLDFGPDDGLQGFVGGGAGVARVNVHNSVAANGPGWLDDTDTGFAWQALAGVRAPINDHWDAGLKYRYFNAGKIKLVDTAGRDVRTKLTTHSLLGTLTYNFGGVEAPPPPPPPPVVECAKGPYIVFFDWDKSDITPEASTILDSAVSAYANCANVPIMLAGHADRSGSATYNVGLSERRNASVRGYLTSHGIPDGAITSQAFGETVNRVPTADGVRELQNRRVEITYGPGSGM